MRLLFVFMRLVTIGVVIERVLMRVICFIVVVMYDESRLPAVDLATSGGAVGCMVWRRRAKGHRVQLDIHCRLEVAAVSETRKHWQEPIQGIGSKDLNKVAIVTDIERIGPLTQWASKLTVLVVGRVHPNVVLFERLDGREVVNRKVDMHPTTMNKTS